MESPGLNYFVVAARGEQWLAGFQERQWAEDWKHQYCRTGLVLTHMEWMNLQMIVLQEEQAKKAMEFRPNGGIRGEAESFGCSCHPHPS